MPESPMPTSLARLPTKPSSSSLSRNADSAEGYRVQGLRRRVAEQWGAVLHKLDNLAHLTKWFVLDCIREEDNDQLTFVLCLLALESTRTIFATVNQSRGALAADTFGYWRTLYESYIMSRFLLTNSAQDPDLPGRFAHSTNAMYLDLFRKFSATDAESEAESSWSKAAQYYTSHYPIQGKGNYGWAYPSSSVRKPTFRHIAESVDADSKYLNEYYDFATSKTHGRFILGFDGPRPTRSGFIGGDNFSTGGIAPVLEFTIPLYDTVVENACASSSAARHHHVMAIVRMAIQDIGRDIATIKSETCRHLRIGTLPSRPRRFGHWCICVTAPASCAVRDSPHPGRSAAPGLRFWHDAQEPVTSSESSTPSDLATGEPSSACGSAFVDTRYG